VEGIFQWQDIFTGGCSLWHDSHKEEHFPSLFQVGRNKTSISIQLQLISSYEICQVKTFIFLSSFPLLLKNQSGYQLLDSGGRQKQQ